MINVAIMGFGTIGSGVYEVIDTNKELIRRRIGQEINVKYVLDLREFPGTPVENIVVHDINTILEDDEVQVVVETMGGTGASYKFVKEALMHGKSVATSNKALVAAYGTELIQIAKDKGANFLFEASVGGGIPIVRPIMTSYSADDILEITGILNGTTNYMLTKMANEGSEFEAVLKNAQELGYAEQDPTADVEGHDSCRKISILTALAFGHEVDYEDIPTEGITAITADDFKYAKSINKSIKLFARCKQIDGGVAAMVCPVLVSPEHPLYNVNDVYNGIFIKGNVVGDTMLYGSGAGKLPTASAVVADIVDIAKHLGKNIMLTWEADKLELADPKSFEYKYFVRVRGNAEECVEAIHEAFGSVTVIECQDVDEEFAFITEKMVERDYDAKLANLADEVAVIKMLRVEE